MTDIILNGCNGKMGAAVTKAVSERNDCRIVAGVDLYGDNINYKVFRSFSEVDIKADVIIDFSNPSVLDSMLSYAKDNRTPMIICTTGFSDTQVEQIKEASKNVAIFYSGNMSLGINLIIELSKKAAAVFSNNFDVEIIEKHHNQKIDAPSGTALMIADAIADVLPDSQYVYDRHSYRQKRSKNEIGIHAVRGGTIVGEHEVIFAGHDEILSLKHQALSKDVFAVGAVNAAVYLKDKQSGMYDMGDLLSET
ncbi:MAG: 4-hydroxy-tetrahydrodipicolinate reductase [Ruminococcaceae bacterium]|nr:4-hydroxy-tetrahydrodipicolinate reductase [Oscillospiraceae bacterium]